MDLNVGRTARSSDESGAPRTSTMSVAALGISVQGPLVWALERYDYPGTSGEAGSAPVVALLAEPTLIVRQEVALDLGDIIPVAGTQPRAVYVEVVAHLGRWFRRPPVTASTR